jgi:hypothetical protein
MANSRKLFTLTLTNGVFTVTTNEGFQRFSIYNGSDTAGSYIGTLTAGGQESSSISVEQYDTAVVDVGNGYVIEELTITAPEGCTLKIMGS